MGRLVGVVEVVVESVSDGPDSMGFCAVYATAAAPATMRPDTRPHPLLVELRAQRALYLRLVKALKLPCGVVEPSRTPKPKARHGMRELRAVRNPGTA